MVLSNGIAFVWAVFNKKKITTGYTRTNSDSRAGQSVLQFLQSPISEDRMSLYFLTELYEQMQLV